MRETDELTQFPQITSPSETERFVESYGAFTSVVNRLQRDFLKLREESATQADLLEEANKTLRDLALRNRAVTVFLNSILTSVSSAIVAVDRAGAITHLNQQAERVFGLMREAAVGRPYVDVVPGDTFERDSALTALALGQSDEPVRNVEKKLMCADGEIRAFQSSATPLFDSEGRIFGAVEVFHDISEIKRLEKEMSRIEVLASIGEMAASVAHQVRNPLVSVKGFAQLLTRDIASADPNAARAENILKGVQNLERVIDALLAFSRQETLHCRPTNLDRYLRNIVMQFNSHREQLHPHSPEVRCVESASRAFVAIDHLIFREAVFNIISNALESQAQAVQVTVCVAVESEGRQARISIADDGPGISPAAQEKMFTPFFTTKSNGAGLGLALVKKLVLAHGGALSVTSAPGRGATFHIILPLFRGQVVSDSDTTDEN